MAKPVEAPGRVVAVLAGHYHPGASFRAGSGVLYATAPCPAYRASSRLGPRSGWYSCSDQSDLSPGDVTRAHPRGADYLADNLFSGPVMISWQVGIYPRAPLPLVRRLARALSLAARPLGDGVASAVRSPRRDPSTRTYVPGKPTSRPNRRVFSRALNRTRPRCCN
jgi:hypothetical protein